MWQMFATIISFLLIPILIRKEFKLHITIFIATLTLGIISGIGPKSLLNIIINVFINPSSRDTILTIIMISILGGMMKHYKILDNIVETLLKIIKSKKTILALIPAMIGMLIIPGGAILSAPFVFSLGEELGVPPEKRAAINLTFRHVTTFMLPYSSMLLLIKSAFPDINLYRVIALNAIFVTGAFITAYTLFIKDIDAGPAGERKDIGKNILQLTVLLSPIYIPVLLNISFKIPFYLAVGFSFVIIYFISDKKGFGQVMVESLNWNVVATLAAILMMKDIILNLKDMLILVEGVFIKVNNDFLILAIFFAVSLFFGFITGNSNVPLAITLPILSLIDMPLSSMYIYLYFLCGSAFLGYYFSPIHLCQVFTLEEMGVATGKLYREYRIYSLVITSVLIISSLGLLALVKI